MRPVAAWLLDIEAASTDLLGFVAGLTQADFQLLPERDPKTWRAVKNALAEIGEAAKALPEAVRAEHAQVDWRGLAGLRDLVAHQYFRLGLPRLWPVVADEIPVLLAAVRAERRRTLGQAE